MDDYIEDLCAICALFDECRREKEFPVMECHDFDDGYNGPAYYDSDAVREWRDKVLWGMV